MNHHYELDHQLTLSQTTNSPPLTASTATGLVGPGRGPEEEAGACGGMLGAMGDGR